MKIKAEIRKVNEGLFLRLEPLEGERDFTLNFIQTTLHLPSAVPSSYCGSNSESGDAKGRRPFAEYGMKDAGEARELANRIEDEVRKAGYDFVMA